VFVFGNILIGVAQVLGSLLWLYMWLLIGRAIISWVNADPRNPIVRFLITVTDPPQRVIRRMLPSSLRYFPLDIAFLVLFGLVIFARFAVVQTLEDLGQRLRQPTYYVPPAAVEAPPPSFSTPLAPPVTPMPITPAPTAPSASPTRNP
jgi:YggT family protein